MKKFAKLKPEQQKAIKLLTAMSLDLNDGETKKRRTYEDIAREVGVTPQTLIKWRTQDKDFIEAREEFTEAIADEMLSEVYSAIKKQIIAKKPNMKAAELYLKTRGKLIDRKEVQADVNQNITEVSNKSNDDLRKELDELRGKVLNEGVMDEVTE